MSGIDQPLTLCRENEFKYFADGHDTARSEFDMNLLKDQPDITAFMFCGVGDERHLYATLTKIHSHTRQNTYLETKRYHFTLLDLKPAILARDLIVFSLLDDLSRLRTGSEEELDTLLTLFYTWAGVLMPAYACDGLQRTISQVLLGLEKDLVPSCSRYQSKSDHR